MADIESIYQRRTDSKILDCIKAKHNYSQVDSADASWKTIKGGIGQFKHTGSQAGIGRNQTGKCRRKLALLERRSKFKVLGGLNMATIEQIQIKFVAVEDRLLLRVSSSDELEFRFWMTRRFIDLIWPALHQAVAEAPHAIFQELGFEEHVAPISNSRKMLPGFYKVSKNTPFMAPAVEKNIQKYLNMVELSTNRAIRNSRR